MEDSIRFYYIKEEVHGPEIIRMSGVQTQVTLKPVGCIASKIVNDSVVFGWSACSRKDNFLKDKAKAIAVNRLSKAEELFQSNELEGFRYGGKVPKGEGAIVLMLQEIVKQGTVPAYVRDIALDKAMRLSAQSRLVSKGGL